MEKTFQFRLNGKPIQVSSPPERKLLWVLRTDLNLTGTKHSCGEGFCAACTVLIDGEAALSCQYAMENVGGRDITTIEGLSKNGQLHPIQEAFLQHNALQCGYCTPGMILGAYRLLMKNPQPSRDQIVEAMEGHLCRCGSYDRIIKAIQTAAHSMRPIS